MGINNGFMVAQLLNLVLVAVWIGLVVVALMRIARQPLTEGERLAWTLIILLIPLFGALAFLLTRPKSSAT
ncbi:MAG: PLDc N-terminal domain-containing protein [Anaerolineae bacterium]|jgi:hypothetical protein|nr:PLDc N-terminal domain-containing protein [Anaerolineae bacterium]